MVRLNVIFTRRIELVTLFGVYCLKFRLDERHLLDLAEGRGCGYEYKTVRVKSNKSVIEAGAYYATHIDAVAAPI